MTVAELIEELKKYDPDMTIGIPNQLERSGKCVLDDPEIYPVQAIDFPRNTHVLFLIARERKVNDSQ